MVIEASGIMVSHAELDLRTAVFVLYDDVSLKFLYAKNLISELLIIV